MKKKKGLIIIGVVIILVILISVVILKVKPKTENISVATTTETKQVVEASGLIKVNESRDVIIDFTSEVVNVPVKEGQKVKKGETIMTIDLSDIKKEIEDKTRELKIQKLELDKLQKNGVQSTQNNIGSKEQELARMKSDLLVKENYIRNNTEPDISKLVNSIKILGDSYKDAQEDYKQKQELFNLGTVSKRELDDSKSSLDNAEKSLKEANLSLESTKYSKQTEVEKLKSSIKQSTADISNLKLDLGQSGTNINIQKEKINKLEVELQQLKDKLSKSHLLENNLICDIENGVVTNLNISNGAMIQTNTKVYTLLDLDSLVAEVEIPEEYVSAVKLGAVVKILPTADPGKEYKGKVVSIAEQAIESNGNTVVKAQISIDNNDGLLKPNFNVDVEITEWYKKTEQFENMQGGVILKRLIYVVTCIMFIFSSIVFAEEATTDTNAVSATPQKFSISEAIAYAKEHNYKILLSKIDDEIMKKDKQNAEDTQDLANDLYKETKNNDNFSNYKTRAGYNTQMVKNQARMLVLQNKQTELSLEVSVETAYYALSEKKLTYDTKKRTLEQIKRQSDVASKKLELGDISELTYKNVMLEKGTAEVALMNAESEYKKAKMDFNQALGLPLFEEVTLTDEITYITYKVPTFDDKLVNLKENNTAYVQNLRDKELLDFETRLMRTYYGYKSNQYKQIVLKGEQNEINFNHSMEMMEYNLILDIIKLNISARNIDLDIESKEISKLTLEAAKMKYSEGLISEMDMISAELEYQNAELKYIKEVHSYKTEVLRFEKNVE